MNDNEKPIRELIEGAGRRPEIPAEDFAAIQAAARQEWKKLVAEEQARRRWRAVPLALAASLILALVVAWWWRKGSPPPAPEMVATVEVLKGELRLEEGKPAAVGQPLLSGTVLSTTGRAALRLTGGESVRLDSGTKVRLAAGRLELEAGAVYVDSQRPAGSLETGSLEIGTAFGSVQEIGTQFEVRLEDGDGLRVRVREGAVSLLRAGGPEAVSEGGELRVRRDGSIGRSKIDPHGPEWDWVLAAAPALDIDGLTLGEYLDWASRETGLKVRYENQTLAGLAGTVRLRGSIAGLAPDESLSVILPGSSLGYRIDRGTLLITKLPGQ